MLAYERDLLEIGGRTPYGDPTFILIRGSDPIKRASGVLERSDAAHQFRDGWLLMEWLPPSEFGPESDWPGEQYGPYPHRGRYTLLQPFPRQRLDTLYLNSRVVRMMAWRSREHRRDSETKRRQAYRDSREQAERVRENHIADMLHDAFPSFTGPTSFANNPTTRTAVQSKLNTLEEMERRGGLQTPLPRGPVQRPSR